VRPNPHLSGHVCPKPHSRALSPWGMWTPAGGARVTPAIMPQPVPRDRVTPPCCGGRGSVTRSFSWQRRRHRQQHWAHRSQINGGFDRQAAGRVGTTPSPGSPCRHLLARHSTAATRRAPAPPVPPPPAWSTGERGVLTALPGRTPRSYGKNRVSGTISCEFPGRAGRAGIARRLRRALPQTCSPPAARPSARKASGWNPSPPCTGPSNAHRGLDNQPAARAEVGIVGTLRSTGARVPRAPSTGSSCDGEATQTMTYDSDRALAS
jgi:hypothetical protein